MVQWSFMKALSVLPTHKHSFQRTSIDGTEFKAFLQQIKTLGEANHSHINSFHLWQKIPAPALLLLGRLQGGMHWYTCIPALIPGPRKI